MNKERLDKLLIRQGLAPDEKRAQALILSGKVIVNGHPIEKVGYLVPENAQIRLRSKTKSHPYVSRGGLKLKAALEDFKVSVLGQVVMDVGASTGGFTDCLLQEGAKKVYAVDVGYGQLDWSLRKDPRVVVLERTNIRTFNPKGIITEALDLIVIDVSFISLRLVVPTVKNMLSSEGKLIALIKPQFEAPREWVEKGGVVGDQRLKAAILKEMTSFFHEEGFKELKTSPSPLLGPAGNEEFFIYGVKGKEDGH